jgi:cyanophycin synthetase
MSLALERPVFAAGAALADAFGPVPMPDSFDGWRRSVRQRGALPVIAVAGSRGKTTVVRLLDAIFTAAGMKTATWTDAGVEIRGRRQRSELAAWGQALRRLAAGTLDVAIQELDWPTVHAVGLPPDAYPVAAVTNICVNNDRCLVRPETRLAIRAYDRVRDAARRDGVLVLNGDDYAVAGTEVERATPAFLVGLNPDAPILRAHLSEGGRAAWVEGGWIALGTATNSVSVVAVEHLPFALGGIAPFEVHNGLIAAAVAGVCGMPETTTAAALATFAIPPTAAGSFNVLPIGDALAIVDRPSPSWFLRPVLRAVRHHPHRSTIIVAGRLDGVPDDDVHEVGRLLARASDALVLHSAGMEDDRLVALRTGIDAVDAPRVVLQQATERQGVNKALRLVRPGDLLLVLADQPGPVLRVLTRSTAPLADSSVEADQELEPAGLPA